MNKKETIETQLDCKAAASLRESIKQDLELSNINYDMRFWDNYFDQLIDSTRKDPPMFRNGGLV